MADLQKLINTILSDPKIGSGRNFASKVYRDEPIVLTATQMERLTPSKYRAMRKIAGKNGLYHDSEVKIFYEQGRFMADFEDDFDYQGEFSRYYPTYQAMNDQQLRGYFSWRTKLRRGRVEKTSLSFVFVYIYELLNQIGVGSPEEGFHLLQDFWRAYKEINPQIDGYVRNWLKDYVVYYNLDQSFLEGLAETEVDLAVLKLLDYKSQNPEEVFAALNSLSSYDLYNSRFYKQHPEVVENIVGDVFCAFSDYCNKKNKKTLCEKFFGKIYASSYFMFKSAVFYNQSPRRNYVYEISGIHKYICRDGLWTCERFFRYRDKNQHIGAMLKAIDFHLRQKYNFKSTLKAGQTTKTLEGLIKASIDQYQARQREAVRREINIDLSKIQGIRAASLTTQGKLIIDEVIDEAPDAAGPEIPPEKVEAKNETGLSDLEYLFMSLILYDRDYEELIRSQGLMLSVLIDSINEKLYDLFGDTVITDAGGRPELIADYMNELKEIIDE